jgi:hypothetical protein
MENSSLAIARHARIARKNHIGHATDEDIVDKFRSHPNFPIRHCRADGTRLITALSLSYPAIYCTAAFLLLLSTYTCFH